MVMDLETIFKLAEVGMPLVTSIGIGTAVAGTYLSAREMYKIFGPEPEDPREYSK